MISIVSLIPFRVHYTLRFNSMPDTFHDLEYRHSDIYNTYFLENSQWWAMIRDFFFVFVSFLTSRKQANEMIVLAHQNSHFGQMAHKKLKLNSECNKNGQKHKYWQCQRNVHNRYWLLCGSSSVINTGWKCEQNLLIRIGTSHYQSHISFGILWRLQISI